MECVSCLGDLRVAEGGVRLEVSHGKKAGDDPAATSVEE